MTENSDIFKPAGAVTATAGSFDGVHLGHQAVLTELRRVAAEREQHPLAITFDPHPLEIIAPHRAPRLLLSRGRQEELIRAAGSDFLRLPFTPETAAISARDWMRLLRDSYRVRTLIVGYDNTFGHDGIDMSIADYIELGRGEGIDVIEAPMIAGVSSSRIRRAVSEGDVSSAAGMLGRPYEIEGVVIPGEALGRQIGYPTANLGIHPRRLLPADGSYATAARMPDGTLLPAMLNIGSRPTVDNSGRRSIEAHIIGWNGDIYCNTLSLQILTRLRDERRFDSIEALTHQLEEDRAKSIDIFESSDLIDVPQTL